jgi:hypothetical protein
MDCKICGAAGLELAQTPTAGLKDLRRGLTAAADDDGDGRLTLFTAGAITASTLTRTLAGPVVRYGVPGRTSVGRLKVRPGALRFPAELTRVKLTEEHDRAKSRGHLTAVTDDGQTIRAALKVSDGPLGDAALSEAADRTRDGFSFDVIDATVQGDELVDALVIAIGQVGIPAYDDSRIDTIAASQNAAGTAPAQQEGHDMTEEQRRRLAELRAMQTRTAEQQGELDQLAQLEAPSGNVADAAPGSPASSPAGQGVANPPAPVGASGSSQAASTGAPQQAAVMASVPAGAPSPAPARTSQEGALQRFVSTVTQALRPGGGGAHAITAALSDVTWSSQQGVIEAPAWSGELWSGVAYEPQFTPLLASGDLTNWEGSGWRWVTKPEMKDYTGDKAAIASDPIDTEPSGYEAARMAVGHDIDRKFYDFPNEAFLRGYLEAVRESWAMKLDLKVEAWIASHAVPVQDAVPADITEDSVLKAAARGVLALKRRKVGAATFVVLNDEDWFSLFDVTSNNRPAFLDVFGVNPPSFRNSDLVDQGTVIIGAKQTATVRTLPGSPIRADAQHLANGGIDSAFFGYWAIEEHHTSGIASVGYDPTP